MLPVVYVFKILVRISNIMEEKHIYSLLISFIPTDKLKLLSAKIQLLSNEINTELYERNGVIYSIDLYLSGENEIIVRGNSISEYGNEINYEFKKYGYSSVTVIDINSISIEYTHAEDAQRAIEHRNELLYAIKKIFIN